MTARVVARGHSGDALSTRDSVSRTRKRQKKSLAAHPYIQMDWRVRRGFGSVTCLRHFFCHQPLIHLRGDDGRTKLRLLELPSRNASGLQINFTGCKKEILYHFHRTRNSGSETDSIPRGEDALLGVFFFFFFFFWQQKGEKCSTKKGA